jgi:hypothetical protein
VSRASMTKTVQDMKGGEVVRIHAGLVRITHRMVRGERWAILLRDDMTETADCLWLALTTKVLEVLPQHRAMVQGEEADPLRCAK